LFGRSGTGQVEPLGGDRALAEGTLELVEDLHDRSAGRRDGRFTEVVAHLGRYDYNTPSPLAAEYLDRLRAPLKELVWFERSAHFPFVEQPERFHTELLRAERAANIYRAGGGAGGAAR
jgi:pimeloyl-ACP methyl ester carboxylesterase